VAIIFNTLYTKSYHFGVFFRFTDQIVVHLQNAKARPISFMK